MSDENGRLAVVGLRVEYVEASEDEPARALAYMVTQMDPHGLLLGVVGAECLRTSEAKAAFGAFMGEAIRSVILDRTGVDVTWNEARECDTLAEFSAALQSPLGGVH